MNAVSFSEFESGFRKNSDLALFCMAVAIRDELYSRGYDVDFLFNLALYEE